MKKFLLTAVILCLCLAGCARRATAEMPEDFSFLLVWGVMGMSSYDGTDGTLVRSSAEPNKDAYRTTLILNEEQHAAAWEAISALDWEKYPSEYNPAPDRMSAPSADIELTVTANGQTHTVRCENVALGYLSDDRDGQAFLRTIESLEEIITSTDEWKSFPDLTVEFD